MIIGGTSLIPPGYRIINMEVTVPLGIIAGAHLLWPFALNPWFISFSVSYSSWLLRTANLLVLDILYQFGYFGSNLRRIYSSQRMHASTIRVSIQTIHSIHRILCI